MKLSNDTKVQLFDLALWYFLPLVAVNFVASFLGSLVEQSWLPSEKETAAYYVAFYGAYVLRLVGGLLVFFLYLEKCQPPFSRHLKGTALFIGLAFGSALNAFFFLATMVSPGFQPVPNAGWLFIWEVLLFRYVPLFMFYGVAFEFVLHNRHWIWKHVLLIAGLQFLWGLMTQLWDISQGGHVFDFYALYPMTTVILAVALAKRFGLYAGLGALFINAASYQIVLFFGRFPLPSHVNSFLTLLCLALLVRLVQKFPLRPELMSRLGSRLDFRSRSTAGESVQPEHG